MKVLPKLYIGFGTIIALLAVLVSVSFLSFAKMSEANTLRENSYQILAGTQTMREGLVNMDIAARGFVITGQKDFLPALFKGQKEFLESSQQVRDLTAANRSQQARLLALKGSYDQWVASYFEPLKAKWLASRNHRVNLDDVFRISKQGQPYTEEMYSLVADINKVSAAKVVQSTTIARRMKLLTQIVLLVGGGFTVLLAIALSAMLTHSTRELSQANSELEGEIAERKLIEEALQRARLAAEAASRSKSEFLANMSHELRTPLNAIIGFSELLSDKTFGDLNTRQDKYVTNVLTSGRHLLKLINDILDLSKIEAGRMELEPSTFDVDTCIHDVVSIVRTLASRKNIVVSVGVEAGVAAINADESKFKQILYNLLSNAIKFTPDGGAVGVVAAPTYLADGKGALRVTITDSGIGIKPEDQARIFGEFEQIDSTYGRSQQGTGLGLSLTQRFVELHGGNIRVESHGEGYGSSFIFELPLVPAQRSAISAGSIAAGVEHNQGVQRATSDSRPLVLVVENDPQARELLTHYLTEAGYLVAQAEDGDQALKMARELTLHAIILDILLPKQNGWDVLTQLKSQPETQTIPVIIASVTENKELGFSLGAIEYFVKPVNREMLVEAVRHARDQAQRSDITVLVVDDDPLDVETLTHALEALNCKVLPAFGGEQGFELANKELPQLIILDLLMPGVSGFDLVRRLRANPRTIDIPVLIFTAKDITEEDRRQLNLHVRAIVPKSGRDELLRELSKLNNSTGPAA